MSKKYLIAGLGLTGGSVARYLTRRNIPFVLYDTRTTLDNSEELQQSYPGSDIFLGEFPEKAMGGIEKIIASPGVVLSAAMVEQAVAHTIPIIGDIECLALEITTPIIAITGTNGKSTVTSLVGEILKADGLRVAVAGNIGTPVLDLLDDTQKYDIWVLELSSFQLDLTCSLKPKIATILNISADHLDRHGSIVQYINSKHRIYNNAQAILYNTEDLKTAPRSAYLPLPRIGFSLGEPENDNWGVVCSDGTNYLTQGSKKLIAINALKIKGKHNWQNALAAAALASHVGASVESIVGVLQSYSGLPHRCQWVRAVDGVSWINDSKGTNIGACASALAGVGESCSGKVVVIAGGLGKGADFSALYPVVSRYARCLVLIGTDADKIAQALDSAVPTYRQNSMKEAILCAKKHAQIDDVVLLSPACASQDMFRDYNHRGEVFTQLVHEL